MKKHFGKIHMGKYQRPRRFPPPWSVEEQEACFVVRDPYTR